MTKLALALSLTAALLALSGTGSAAAQAHAVKPVVISITVEKGRPVGGIKRPTVKKGRLVRIVVVTDAGKELHLHGYDIEKTPRLGKRTVMQFNAKLPGRFELELHSPNALLADITVKP